MRKHQVNKISKIDFMKLNEEDVMFITNPGRMGDEDGSTFVVKNGNELFLYRVDGFMYPNRTTTKEYNITIKDMKKQFPKWHEAWKHGNEKDYKGKYQYLYMGFGNGLSVDNSIYNEFKPYLNKLVEEYLKDKKDSKEDLKYAAIYNVWQEALMKMLEEKNIMLK